MIVVVVVSKPFGTRISRGKKRKRERDNKKKRKKRKNKKEVIKFFCTILTRILSLSNYPPTDATCVF
jgi:hypothetical protein